MSIPIYCENCGYRGISQMFNIIDSKDITIVGMKEVCPECGGLADVQSGTYDFVGRVMATFTAPGMTKAKISAFQDVARKASSGQITTPDAIEILEKISADLADLARSAHKRNVNWELIIAIIALFYAYWSDYTSDFAAQSELAESRKQTEVSEKILEVLERPNAQPKSDAPANQQRPTAAQPPKAFHGNRHDRLKAAAKERRAAKPRRPRPQK